MFSQNINPVLQIRDAQSLANSNTESLNSVGLYITNININQSCDKTVHRQDNISGFVKAY